MQPVNTGLIPRISILLLFLLATTSAFAQSTTGWSGRIIDANGDVVPGASVVLEKRDVRFRTETVADANGAYTFSQLPKGEYVVTVTAPSLAPLTRTQSIPSGGPTDLILEPRTVAAEVSVTTSYLTGSPESHTEVPGSIQRLDPRTLENSRVFNFSEALRKIAGVNVRDEEGFG